MSTINVNLAQCTCGGRSKDGQPFWSSGEHHSMCHATPILLPYRLPGSFAAEVPLGECISPAACGLFSKAHLPDCPARPVRVTCSITGKTWADSEIGEWDSEDVSIYDDEAMGRVYVSLRDRWSLVKALVLGHSDLSALITGPMAADLLTQRYAVFSAICEMVRAEEALAKSVAIAGKTIASPAFPPPVVVRYAESALAAYVERLIEQVGGMT